MFWGLPLGGRDLPNMLSLSLSALSQQAICLFLVNTGEDLRVIEEGESLGGHRREGFEGQFVYVLPV